MSLPRHSPEDGKQLDLFHARPGTMPLRDAQDLMSYSFFSLAKSPRVKPIGVRMGEIVIRVQATLEHGMATIWDADVLIWAASQIVDARDHGLALFIRYWLMTTPALPEQVQAAARVKGRSDI